MSLYLITGGAGFVGSSLAESLLAQGARVRVLDDFSTGRRQNLETLSGAVELVEGSILDPACVERAMRGVEVVFHEAAIPSVSRSVENPTRSMQVNVQGTTELLQAAHQAGVKRFLFAASSSAYGNTAVLPKVETMSPAPLSPYAVSKLAGEQLLRVFSLMYGMETLSLRYFNVFGPRQDPAGEYAAVVPRFLLSMLHRHTPVVFGDGAQTRDFCYIDNVVQANLLAASTPHKLTGQVVNIACGAQISLLQLLEVITQEGRERGILGPNEALPVDHRPSRSGDVRDSFADITAAEQLLGYRPRVEVREGIRKTLEALQGS